MPVSENKILTLAFLATLALHLVLISPMSKWLSYELVPQFAGESLEVDINEIQSNTLLPHQPQQAKEKRLPEKREKELEESRHLPPENRLQAQDRVQIPVPKEKMQLSPDVKEDSLLSESEQSVTEKPLKTDTHEPQLEEERQAAKKMKVEDEETIGLERSPLFYEKEKIKRPKSKPLPDEIKQTFRDRKPEDTGAENLQFSMNTYKWSFKRFIANWVVDIQKWWKAPIDYLTGKMPEGGDLWVQVHLARSGRLLSYKIIRSNVTPEMELRAIQALIGSLKRPRLPSSFKEEELVINWKFIYPPLRPPLKLKR